MMKSIRGSLFVPILLGMVIGGVVFLSGCGEPKSDAEDDVAYYTCGMHPSVKSDEPGKCPICHMDLVPVTLETEKDETSEMEGGHEGHADPDAEEEKTQTLKASRRARQLAGVKTAEVVHRHLHKQIRTVGRITMDERRVAHVAAWIPGRIDKLLIDFTGQTIRKGDALALVYSPELVSTQREYLLALDALDRASLKGDEVASGLNASMLESVRQRLLLWGVSDEHIRRLETEKKVEEHITVTAPIGGTVVEKAVQEGQYVKEGQHLYTVADLSRLWMLADVYEYELGWIAEGQKIRITSSSFPGEVFEGTINFIDPVLHARTRSVKVRGELDNPQARLKPGMFVDVAIDVHLEAEHFPTLAGAFSEDGGVLSVPASAVLQTGKRSIVYQEIGEGEYVARAVDVGPRTGDYYPLLSGLSAGDRIVVRGNFLIDSQTQLTGLESAVYDAALGEKKAAGHAGHTH